MSPCGTGFQQKTLEIIADGTEQLLPKPEPSKSVHPAVQGWGWAVPQVLGQNQAHPVQQQGTTYPERIVPLG